MKLTTKRAKAGRKSSKRKAGNEIKAQQPPELSPLDYALALMRDETQPAALRASMAKAALPYLHTRFAGEPDETEEQPEPPKPPMSDLECARRIAHIFARAGV